MSLRNQRGFSLIELAIVVLVAGLVLAITSPAINRFLIQSRLRDAGSRVAGDLRLARQKAVTNSSRVWFRTTNGSSQYMVGEQRWTGGSTSTEASFSTTAWKTFSLPSTVRVAGANWNGLNYFKYLADGRPSNAGSMKLVTTVGAPDTVTLNVDLSGMVWK